jgi:hypothetical protein
LFIGMVLGCAGNVLCPRHQMSGEVRFRLDGVGESLQSALERGSGQVGLRIRHLQPYLGTFVLAAPYGQPSAELIGALPHTLEPEMTARVALNLRDGRHTTAVIAYLEPDVMLLVSNFHFNVPGICMGDGVRKGLASDAIDLLCCALLQALRSARNHEPNA